MLHALVSLRVSAISSILSFCHFVQQWFMIIRCGFAARCLMSCLEMPRSGRVSGPFSLVSTT